MTSRVLCGPGVSGESKVNVGLTQGSAWSPLLFIAMVKLISRKICTKVILRKLLYSDAWPGSSSERGSNSPRTADRVEKYVQQTWTESMFGEDGWDIGGKSCKYTRMGRRLSKETVLSTWVERYVELAVRQSQKGKTFRVWLGRWRECSVKRGKGKFLYGAYPILSIAQSVLHFTSLAVLFIQTPSLGRMREGCSHT